jgi:hypothetical protein
MPALGEIRKFGGKVGEAIQSEEIRLFNKIHVTENTAFLLSPEFP